MVDQCVNGLRRALNTEAVGWNSALGTDVCRISVLYCLVVSCDMLILYHRTHLNCSADSTNGNRHTVDKELQNVFD